MKLKHEIPRRNARHRRGKYPPDSLRHRVPGRVSCFGWRRPGRHPLGRRGGRAAFDRCVGWLFACWLGCSALVVRASDWQPTNLLALATAENVRIRLGWPASPWSGPLELEGELVPVGGGPVLWRGVLAEVRADVAGELERTIGPLKPRLWEPASPQLYVFKVAAKRAGQTIAARSVRFGFRSFEAREGRFWLNGRPIFLRGVAINPPGRGVPEAVGESRAFAEAYVRFLKSQNVNCMRISTDVSQTWFDVCDELGMMLYAGHYGWLPGMSRAGAELPQDDVALVAWYRRLWEQYASHPSIVLYVLANELPVSGARGAAVSQKLQRLLAALKRFDDTRPYIANAGYGEGREGDVCDVHRYWGWYYNSFLTFYNLRDRLRASPLYGQPGKNQPLTFTESVGAFTGPTGEFNLVRSKQLAPRLGWIGHTATPREDALRYQSFLVQEACESFRRMRPLNPRLAGVMPFTIFFYNWAGITAFEQMQPKPAMDSLRLAYQPVLLSWELWTPQVYAGAELRPVAHVVNDDDLGRPLTNALLRWQLRSRAGDLLRQGELTLPPLPYFATWRAPLSLTLPTNLPTGEYRLSGCILAAGQTRSTNECELFVAAADWKRDFPKPVRPVWLYDPSGRTATALDALGIPYRRLSDAAAPWPAEMKALVVGEKAWDGALTAARTALRQWVRQGGRVLCLQPEPARFQSDWLPAQIEFLEGSANDPEYPPRSRPFREQSHVNPERPDHPVFRGLSRERLRLWSDYTGWDQTRPGFPKLYPVTCGFKLLNPEALAHAAVLADYDRGLEGVALCELFDGSGSVLLSGLDLVERAGLDPAAERLLANLVAYVADPEGHDPYPLIDAPIRWGDFPTERGAVCGSLNGLLVHCEWQPPPTQPHAEPLPPNTGSWNMRPGEQFSPRGRNAFGPFGYSTGSSLRDLNREQPIGSGFFWVRVPPGKRNVVTVVYNPTDLPAELNVELNGSAHAPAAVPPRATVKVRTPLPAQTTNLCVRYTAPKTLVLRETRFE